MNIVDRRTHAEARTISFIAEHSLPLSIAPNLVDFAKEMAPDKKALDGITMGRKSASYKLTVVNGQFVNCLA